MLFIGGAGVQNRKPSILIILHLACDQNTGFIFALLLVGDILIGFSADDASYRFPASSRDMMLTITGVDVRPIDFRWKFVFITQIGSPQTV